MGRPRRPAGPAGRVVPAEPTALERALADPELAGALVARLKARAIDDGDVAACRDLLRLVSEAEATATERALLEAERAEAEALAAEARARKAEELAQTLAAAELESMAEENAHARGQEEPGYYNERALVLLDAVEVDLEAGKVTAVKPWVVEAARAHDPGLPRYGELRPLDLRDPEDALPRLGVGDLCNDTLAGWFIDAALARRPDPAMPPGEAAEIALVRDDGEPPDWVARLAAVRGEAP